MATAAAATPLPPPAYAPARPIASGPPPPKFCIGVDFGTVHSGFAIHRLHATRPAESRTIIGKDDWADQPSGVFSQKVPTLIAYRRDQHPRADPLWGWSARKAKSGEYERIERVKLALEASTPPALQPTIPADMTSEDVIADFLGALRAEMMGIIAATYPVDLPSLRPSDFLFCFTVPVGWSNDAHHALRRAACKAQLIDDENSPHLQFCYEPEAAALACVFESAFDVEPNSSMLVVDCGGGTVDLFLCRLGESRELEELTVGEGRFLGATRVDSLFWNFMREKIGLRAFAEFKSNPQFQHPYLDMEWKWEFLKRQFNGTLQQNEVFQLPPSLLKLMPAAKVEELQLGEIPVTTEDMRSFFDPVVDEIVQLVRAQLVQARSAGLDAIKYLYVVGGFGCNKYLQDRVTQDEIVRELVQYPVKPQRPEAAVLRGAVWCAVNHNSIKSRRARRTIGIGVLRAFNPDLDSLDEIVDRDPNALDDLSRAFCAKAVYVFVAKGQSVPTNARHVRRGFRIKNAAQRLMNVNVYATDAVPPPGATKLETAECALLGRISVELPPLHDGAIVMSGAPPPPLPTFTIEIGYGRVELDIRIIDEATGQQWTRYLNHGHFTIH